MSVVSVLIESPLCERVTYPVVPPYVLAVALLSPMKLDRVEQVSTLESSPYSEMEARVSALCIIDDQSCNGGLFVLLVISHST